MHVKTLILKLFSQIEHIYNEKYCFYLNFKYIFALNLALLNLNYFNNNHFNFEFF